MGVTFGKITVETPAHTVVHETPNYQIWRYPPRIAATVHAKDLSLPEESTERNFSSAAFRTLARYIGVFGAPQNRINENTQDGESIAMTAPVVMNTERVAMTAPVDIQSDGDPQTMRMSFFLPSKYQSVTSAPIPTNPAVKLESLPGGYHAVVTFSGNLSMAGSKEKANVLIQELEKDGFTIVGEWSYCGYNPPYTLPWLKRNEVHIPVDGRQFDNITT